MGVDSGNPVELELMEQTGLTAASTSGSKESPTCIFLVLCFWYRDLRFRFSN
jgi:hypothetical protein